MAVAVIYSEANIALGERIRADLEHNQFDVRDHVQSGTDSLLVVVLSNSALGDQHVEQAIVAALENNQHVIPVIADDVTLPKLIDNLPVVDFSRGYETQRIVRRVEALSDPDAPPPMVTLTPARRAANRRTASWLIGITVIFFFASLWAIVFGGAQPPTDEFAGVETQIYLTRNFYIDGALPLSTEDATGFAATVENVPTRARVQLVETATAISAGVQGTFVPRSTQDATNFPATLNAVSTVVRDELIATATAVAGE